MDWSQPAVNRAALAAAAGSILLAGLAVALALVNAAAAKDLPAGAVPESAGIGPLNLVMALTFGPAGLLILRSRPRHRIGWIFLAIGVSQAAVQLGQQAAFYLLEVNPAWPALGAAVFWLQEFLFFPAFCLFILLLMLFPDGQPLAGRRWRRLLWVPAAATALYLLSMLVEPFTDPQPLGFTAPAEDPFGAGDFLFDLAALGLYFSLLAAVAGLAVRFRRSRGVERQQMKWFVFAGLLFGAAFLFVAVMSIWPVLDPAVLERPGFRLALRTSQGLFAAAGGLIPAAVVAAVLRYRLYGIDVIIRRTLLYSSLTFVFAVLYAGMVVLLQALFFWVTRQERSELAIVLTTLAIAALFQPVRRRVLTAVDRRFYRSRYDAEQALAGFAAGLSQEVDLQAIVARMEALVDETLQPAGAFVWLLKPAAEQGAEEPRNPG